MSPVGTLPPQKSARDRRRSSGLSGRSLWAEGEPFVFLTGAGMVVCVGMILALLALVLRQGLTTFWPIPVVRLETETGGPVMGEVTRSERFRPSRAVIESLPEPVRERAEQMAAEGDGTVRRRLVRIGNYELTNEHFRWVADYEVAPGGESHPTWVLVIERQAWGRFYGEPVSLTAGGEVAAREPEAIWDRFEEVHPEVRERFRRARSIEKHDIGRVNHRLESARLEAREAEIEFGPASPEAAAARERLERIQRECEEEFARLRRRIDELDRANEGFLLRVRTADGQEVDLPLASIVRAYPANRLSFMDAAGVYLSRWWEFLTDEPREANSEGGVFPAIFGTVVMTLFMCLVVVPFGVLAALYLREYAKAGFVVSAVRIAVNNLAGVPSIVFGVFGLGFFCYFVGGTIDQLFFEERLPSPTYGTGGILWASLTLALLTLPVVIVATEEALAAVPSSMREGSYACGASKWQTIRRIVLPRAMPGIMTGMILAMARGAGEVAPLMLVGAVKLAPELPVDGIFPYIHPERSFMHLGFHIYDLGFQSQNSEAAKPMVYTTTLLLIAIVVTLNVAAIWVRARLRRRFAVSQI